MPKTRQASTARDNFIAYLRDRGKRVTPERVKILDTVLADTALFTADSLHTTLSSGGFQVALGTVYNTVELMVAAGLLRQIKFSDSQTTCYQQATPSGAAIYCRCSSCGDLRQVSPKDLIKYISGHEFATFSPTGFTLCFDGVCRKCQRKESKRAHKAKHDKSEHSKKP